jgi:ABC-type dipeptide/oligopeptide/nickel transport system permease subunit
MSNDGTAVVLGIICLIISLFAGLQSGFSSGYKRGQIDALSGKIKYELVQHDDKTVTWEEVK